MEVFSLKMICALFLLALFVYTDGQTCEFHTSCETCIGHGCGWCKDSNVGGRPRCINNTSDLAIPSARCVDLVLPGQSAVDILKRKRKSMFSQTKVKVNLEHGSPVQVPLEITIPADIDPQCVLLLKYRDVPSLYQTLDIPLIHKRLYKKRKRPVTFVTAKNIIPNSKIRIKFTIKSVKCATGQKNARLIVRLLQAGLKTLRSQVKFVINMKECQGCSCPVRYQEPSSRKCSGRGTWGCGECTCDVGYSGTSCELSTDDLGKSCRPSGSDQPYCSGRGTCVEGQCECKRRDRHSRTRFSGQFCECDDYSCPYFTNMLCGGPDRGRCLCGKCMCKPGYTGYACGCPESVDTCMASSGTICNGQGYCECGVCRCVGVNNGPTCEVCPVENQEPSSRKCSGRGTWGCGECTCDEGYSGKSCELSTELDKYCIRPGSDVSCSGRGTCVNGMCDCATRNSHSRTRYSGQFCECDDYSCPYFNNMLCGGPDRGRCSCGKCMCEPGYTGKACGCPKSVDTCMASNGKICNGEGTCECGVCRCQRFYKGATCEECPTCPGPCSQLKQCVQCTIFNTGPLSKEECERTCDGVAIRSVDDLDDDKPICQFRDDDDCMFRFTYSPYVRMSGRRVHVLTAKDCPRN